MDLELKGLKTMQGHDGLIFQCSVYIEGKRRFVASNDGNGGCNLYDRTNDDSRNWIRMAEEWAKSLPPRDVTLGETTVTIPCDLDLVIGEFVDQEVERRWLKAKCRNATLFRTADTPPDRWQSVDHRYTPEVRDWIHVRYPGAEIANEII